MPSFSFPSGVASRATRRAEERKGRRAEGTGAPELAQMIVPSGPVSTSTLRRRGPEALEPGVWIGSLEFGGCLRLKLERYGEEYHQQANSDQQQTWDSLIDRGCFFFGASALVSRRFCAADVCWVLRAGWGGRGTGNGHCIARCETRCASGFGKVCSKAPRIRLEG